MPSDLEDAFAAEPGTEAAQAEVLALLVEYLPERFPDTYWRNDSRLIALAPAQACPSCCRTGKLDEK